MAIVIEMKGKIMNSKYVLALDAGTSSSRAILFDHAGHIVSVSQKEFRQIYPKPGWVEHDPLEIWETQRAVAREAIEKAGATPAEISAIGITNQRETTVVWNRETGKPVHNAIVWQCRRTSEYCDDLKRRGLADSIREKTGLIPDAYFSGTKIRWILENIPGARADAEAGRLLFGTIDTWLIWNLTSGKVHATDYSNASRTMLYDIGALKWDDDILREFNIPKSMLPEVRPSSGSFGASAPDVFGDPLPIAGVAGDQQSALFGQTCFEAGDAKNTYGTGCFLLVHCGDLGHYPNDEQLAAISGADALLIPVGGFYTIDAAMAKRVADAANPRVIVPMHYRHDPYGLRPIGTVEEFLKLYPAARVHHLNGNRFTLTAAEPSGVVVPRYVAP